MKVELHIQGNLELVVYLLDTEEVVEVVDGIGGGASLFHGSGGGSGYVYTSSTASNYPSGCLLNSSHYLTNAQTIAGNKSFPNVAGTSNETGHSGNGAAKITPVN